MKTLLNKLKRSYLLISAGLLMLGSILMYSPAAFALSYLTVPQVILTNMQAGSGSSVIIAFKTSASNTGNTLSLTFTGWTGGSAGIVNTAQTVGNSYNSTNCTAFVPGSPTPVNLGGTVTATGSGATITFSGITGTTASTSYCVVLTSATAVTTPTAVGSYSAVLTDGTDQAAQVAVSVTTLTNQVTVNADVPASFTFSLNGNSDNFTSNLSTIAIETTTGITATMGTNGTGWVVYGFDTNGGLLSANTSHTIPSDVTSCPVNPIGTGTDHYVTGVTSVGGTAAAAFAGGTLGKGCGLTTTVKSLASGTGPTASATATFTEYATIGATTPAATDYTDTITLLGAGTF